MYEEIITRTYDELREAYPEAASVFPESKMIAMLNGNTLNTYSNNSDILVYFDIINPDRPLLVVERVDDSEFESVEALKKFIDNVNNEVEEYVASYNIVEDKNYVDITLVRNNVYDAMMRGKK